MQIWLKSGNGPIDVFLCPDNKENLDPISDSERDHDSSSAASQLSPTKSDIDDNEYMAQSDSASFPSEFDFDLSRFSQECDVQTSPLRQRQRTLSSMNSPESSFENEIKIEEELLSFENIEEIDRDESPFDVDFDSTDYLYSLEQNEGITDLFATM